MKNSLYSTIVKVNVAASSGHGDEFVTSTVGPSFNPCYDWICMSKLEEANNLDHLSLYLVS